MADDASAGRLAPLRALVLRSRDWVFDRPLLTGSALALVLALLIWPRLGFRSPVYEVGDIATATVRVSADFTYEDAAATEERRQEALEVVPDVYDFDPQVRETVRARIARGFAFGRQSIEADTASEDAFAESAAREFGVELARDELALLLGLEFRESVERNLTDAAVSVLARDILAEKSALAALGRPIQRQDAERGEVHVLPDLTDVLSIEDAARAARLQMLALSEESGPDRAALAELAQRFIQPTLARNEVATTRSRASAEENVDPVVIQLREGRTLLRAGDEVTEDHLRRLDAMRAFAPVASPWAGVGALLFTSLAAWILFRLYQPARSGRRWMVHGFALAGALIVAHLAITRLLGFLWRAAAAQSGSEAFVDSSMYVFAVPYAAVPLLSVILENRATAVLNATVFAALVTVMTGNVIVGPFALVSGLIAVLAHSRMARRTDVVRLGSLVGAGSVVVVLGLDLLRADGGDPVRLAVEAASAFGGGLLTAPLVILLLPALEAAFERTSDLRLMELARRDNPVLRRLALYAPGTYQHSVLVGLLSESAASAIGANAILCSTGALYHDIGKLRRAEFFVENMRGANPHDHLPPRQSAIIIIKHVEEGIRDAERLGLPKDIVDMVPQHHGTRRLRVFLERARKAAAENGGTVREEDFRYPGPKPQTREAAIVMMADSIEAAARSVEKPSRVELERVIDRIVDSMMEDDQFDESDLRLGDMVRIRESFLATLEGIHHRRISYPGFDFRKPADA